jgi:hypothetical protein
MTVLTYENQKIVTDGLVLHYDVNNVKCYPGSGNILNDLSSGGNSITATTLNTGTESVNGITTKYCALDTSIFPTKTLSSQLTQFNYSLSYWAKPFATPAADYQPIIRLYDTNSAVYFNSDTRTVASPYILHYYKDFSVNNYNQVAMIDTATYNLYDYRMYTHVMHDYNTWKSYVNGQLVSTITTNISLTGYTKINSFLIGVSKVRLKSLMFYNRSLSADEVYSNYLVTKKHLR